MGLSKEDLDDLSNKHKEVKRLKERLDNINKNEKMVYTVSVRGSDENFPYTEHNYKIEGVKFRNHDLKYKYKKMLKNKQYKLEKALINLEYELNYIEDSEIRDIIRYRYVDNKTWLQIMFLMKYDSESKAKMKLKRYLDKNI